MRKILFIIISFIFIHPSDALSETAPGWRCEMKALSKETYVEVLKKVKDSCCEYGTYVAVTFASKPYQIIYEDHKTLYMSNVLNPSDEGWDNGAVDSWAIRKKDGYALNLFVDDFTFFDESSLGYRNPKKDSAKAAFSAGTCKKLSRIETKAQERQLKKQMKEEQQEIEQEIENEQKEIVKKQNEYEKQYPYKVLLKCGKEGKHLGIHVCFVDTDLTIFDGETVKKYRANNMSRAGNETRQGLLIENVSKDFSIAAQNASPDLVLTLEVYKNDKMVYSRNANQYGVLNFRGN
tara:strand:- start:174 stop:1049 length:876 start_codon:yes stop_codon:yes gene_type:complete